RVDLSRRGKAELEPTETDGGELVFPAVALLEAEPVAVEGDRALEVGRMEDRKRIAEGHGGIIDSCRRPLRPRMGLRECICERSRVRRRRWCSGTVRAAGLVRRI